MPTNVEFTLESEPEMDSPDDYAAPATTSPSSGEITPKSELEYRRRFLEFIDGFTTMIRPTMWSQRAMMYKPDPPPPPAVCRAEEPEEDHLNFAKQLEQVLRIEKLQSIKKLKVNKDYWARKDTSIQSLYYQPKKDMKPKIRDIFATCKPYIPLLLPDDAHEPECNLSCDTWNRDINPPFLSRLENVKILIGHHTFAQLFYVNHSELLGKDPYGSKVFQCKRIKPGLPQVSLDARRQFTRRKDYKHLMPTQFAVKIVDKLDPRSEKFRLYTEVTCLTKLLEHQHIVRAEEVLESETEIYIVTELCCGPRGALTLDEYFPVATDESAQWIFQQLVDAVLHMHKRGVVHNCLTPQNVMFMDDYDEGMDGTLATCRWRTDFFSRVKIIDFNKAVYDPQLSSGYKEFFQPTDYFTMEELAASRADPQNDIKALGRILLAILVGRMPVLNKYYPYRARIEHPEYQYRTKFNPLMVDLYERIFLAIQGEPDYPPTMEAIRNHPWVDAAFALRSRRLKDRPPVSTDYMNCETYLDKFCFPGCRYHHVKNYPHDCQHKQQTSH
ncbi:hypothetical protein MPTK1_3g06890 [Marchantia polymorpha subsp. ruderalis]|uniref:Protein kinase domain-containing protein n=2 Tax=Marchantia polymorpha TaxID=3197 RepID=A0AAF6AY57_MARPO|nr:hypothetical protein MARPO_0006s0157 [Marchantia polymorpha]BBN04691.1 hypothetical protein Mp_3g06890 [Marchantia polymorpha subsp. ruderalis]|eukprot:PTQ48129.1 hypothetical protein MARPO_0006s0157 [Marchantia polymorpha]